MILRRFFVAEHLSHCQASIIQTSASQGFEKTSRKFFLLWRRYGSREEQKESDIDMAENFCHSQPCQNISYYGILNYP